MAVDIQSNTISQTDEPTLDGVLHHHLRLEPPPQPDIQDAPTELDTVTVELQKMKPNNKRAFGQPPMKFGMQVSRPTDRSTIESDNKRRPVVSKRNASRYESPSPEPSDPNSEAKSVTINRMQNNLQEWDEQIKEILQKKGKNDSICSSELASRDHKLKEVNESYSSEHKLRIKTEKQRDKLTTKLGHTEEELVEYKQQVEQLQSESAQYQVAYQESEALRTELEREATLTAEKLEKSEGMRRRLNDQVTELQGHLAIEEQRSKFCIIL